MGLEVFSGSLGVGLDGVGAGRPGRGAGLTHMRVGPLEGPQQAQGLFDRAAHLVVVDLHRADGAGGVYIHQYECNIWGRYTGLDYGWHKIGTAERSTHHGKYILVEERILVDNTYR